MQTKSNLSLSRKLAKPLLISGLFLSGSFAYANEAEIKLAGNTQQTSIDDLEQQEKVKTRLTEIAAEEKAAVKTANGYYVERRSYGTQKETDPPRYVKQANKTWLKDYAAFDDVNWLDLGLEYRARYEHRDNDFRRANENVDDPLLLRTRAYVGVKEILDPLRFAVEVQDSRRNNGDYTRKYDTRDVNQADVLQGYLELHFKESVFGKDDLGNNRPFWIRGGRLAWEALDRRLIARNEWRNTTNSFQGIRANIGEKKNDWQIEAFAVKPVQRFTRQLDEVDHAQDFYGVIGDWRGWSEYVTLQPYYFLLKQDGNKVKYNSNGKELTGSELRQAQIDRKIHTAGLRAYGAFNSGWDYDTSYAKQWGNQDRFLNATLGSINVDHDAYAYGAELGYTYKNSWKPRVSAYYGVATGDSTPGNTVDRGDSQRFERLFGFARPWSNNDYIQMENIRTPKLHLEFEPKVSFLENVKVDTSFSWYRLDDSSDRWQAGNNLRDKTGASGNDLGKEVDLRVRFPVNQYASLNIGYAHFWAGDFVKSNTRKVAGEANRSDSSDFFYTELTVLGF
ncbi:MAG: alginate export family protein [Methylotenera sp.]|uniref:alginate export family protein n=1 Tax=Methylotenera sp. TaxID=2051956 RepID=UPI002488413A|nr:alginate export family protein [Methylotenera sp.]MDI1308225.1 alginate export family protein [Methylotenera sp.]